MGEGLPGSVWIATSTSNDHKALMPHRNAPVPETGRLRLARCIVDDGWSLRRAAERLRLARTGAADRDG